MQVICYSITSFQDSRLNDVLWSNDVRDLEDDGFFNVPFFFSAFLGGQTLYSGEKCWEDSGCLEFSGSDLFFC